ncbi:MAG: IS1634 family transposase [Alphaproteobacteria bacterium]|nr:IS1634 family transposase [Alphaproteobacteria bacterium]
MYFRKKQSEGRIYLQIVESARDGEKVRQHVIATLGRLDELETSGQLERLLKSGARFAQEAMVVAASRNGEAVQVAVRRIGPALVFERLWEETGIKGVLEGFAADGGHKFALERAVFVTALHRLMTSGSDLSADRWKEDYRIAGAEAIALHHLYRAMAWLGEELPNHEQDGATLVPRCRKDAIEERLFQERRDLFSRLDLVFMDTTSLYFEGQGGQSLGAYGHSKDYRPHLKQMILAVLIDGAGNPVCTEMWPGNTADVTTLVPVIDRLRKRFAIERVCVVADRGMISEETVAELEARGLSYILGVRERNNTLVRDLVLADKAPFVPLTLERHRKEIDYGAKVVTLAGRRYIVCINHQEAEHDAAEREAILKSLRRDLKKGAKALVGNTGYRRYLKTGGKDALAIDEARVKQDEKFDGIFVLRTNTALNPLQAMLRYKQLWTIEQTFRTTKHLFTTRPIFHKLDETIRGHVFCSFLALVLKKALEDKLAAVGAKCTWSEVLADLDSLAETEIEHEQKRFVLRASPRPAASLALKAAVVALPPTVQPILA